MKCSSPGKFESQLLEKICLARAGNLAQTQRAYETNSIAYNLRGKDDRKVGPAADHAAKSQSFRKSEQPFAIEHDRPRDSFHHEPGKGKRRS